MPAGCLVWGVSLLVDLSSELRYNRTRQEYVELYSTSCCRGKSATIELEKQTVGSLVKSSIHVGECVVNSYNFRLSMMSHTSQICSLLAEWSVICEPYICMHAGAGGNRACCWLQQLRERHAWIRRRHHLPDMNSVQPALQRTSRSWNASACVLRLFAAIRVVIHSFSQVAVAAVRNGFAGPDFQIKINETKSLGKVRSLSICEEHWIKATLKRGKGAWAIIAGSAWNDNAYHIWKLEYWNINSKFCASKTSRK